MVTGADQLVPLKVTVWRPKAASQKVALAQETSPMTMPSKVSGSITCAADQVDPL